MQRNARKIWLYDKGHAKPAFGRTRLFLYEALRRSLTHHDQEDCHKILALLPLDPSADPHILLRLILILIESVKTKRVHTSFITYLESLLSRQDLAKHELCLEFMSYFIRHNRVEDAKELFNLRSRSLTHLTHRQLPYIDINLRCYEFLLSYLDWGARAFDDLKFDVSIQGWVVNAIEHLKGTTGNYEYFIMCIVQVLLHHGFKIKAYLVASSFQRNNPDNISAQLLLANILKKVIPSGYSQIAMTCDSKEQERDANRTGKLAKINNFVIGDKPEVFEPDVYPLSTDKSNILNNLRRLDIRNDETTEISEFSDDLISKMQDIMDRLEYVSEVGKIVHWEKLQLTLNQILSSNDEELLKQARSLWQTRYQRFWNSDDFLSLVDVEHSESDLIANLLEVLRSNFDSTEEPLFSEEEVNEEEVKMDYDSELYSEVEKFMDSD